MFDVISDIPNNGDTHDEYLEFNIHDLIIELLIRRSF